jgi:hypothetical protein
MAVAEVDQEHQLEPLNTQVEQDTKALFIYLGHNKE